MKAKKLMRWTLALTLTGGCAALVVMALDTWTCTAATSDPSTPPPVVTSAVPIVPSAAGLPPMDPQRRLLEQIETARAGLLAAQAMVPARPTGRAAWLPVVFLAGGSGLIGCAFGLGLGSLILRRRASARTMVTTATAAAASRETRPMTVVPDDSAAAVLPAARAEAAARVADFRGGSPAVSAGPGAAARMQALSRLAAAGESAGPAPSIVSWPTPATGRAIDPEDRPPMRRDDADLVDRRIAALERSLLQVVRAMEEVAERVRDREVSSVRPRPGTRDERETRLRAASSSPVAAVPSSTPVASGPAAAARLAPSVARAVRALSAARDQAPAAPDPWDVPPTARAAQGPAVTGRQEPALPALSTPSPGEADGRDLVRIRRAVLRLAAEGWNGGRIASQLSLGEEDVALIVKTAGAEPWSQPAGRGR